MRVKIVNCKNTPNGQAAIPSFYYDKDENKCKEFILGCGGNGNNFESMAECEKKCSGKILQLKPNIEHRFNASHVLP